MGIKSLAHIIFLFISINCFSQTEVQNKYDVQKSSEFSAFLRNSGNVEHFKTKFHSELTYYDLYFDTPTLLLFEKGYSLRMRKKEEAEGAFAYVFQLKSEMTFANIARMEVEERELDFYKLKVDGDVMNLAELLDKLFSTFESNPNKADYSVYDIFTTAIKSWVIQKSQAPITPFQKLNFIDPEVFSFHTISTLSPQIIGKSIRMRNHIYLDEKDALKMDAISTQNDLEKDRPEFFINAPSKSWILESSLDSAVFYPLFETDHFQSSIIEYEIENKLANPEKGEKLLEEFEKKLNSIYGLKSTINSKYAQSMLIFMDRK